MAGISVIGVTCSIKHNIVHHIGNTGIAIQGTDGKRCSPRVARNVCYRNMGGGIGCRLNALPTVVGNECSRNKAVGIGFDNTESGEADVLNNRVFDNTKMAIGIHAGWKVRLSGNELSRPQGLPPIVMVFKGAEAAFSDNTFRGSGVAGIRAEGIIRVTNNTFDCPTLRAGGPPQFAVWGLPGSDIVFTGNKVSGWRQALVASKSSVTASDNRITNYGSAGIKVDQPVGTSMLVGNMFESESDRVGITITGGNAILDNNRVEKTSEAPPAEKPVTEK